MCMLYKYREAHKHNVMTIGHTKIELKKLKKH